MNKTDITVEVVTQLIAEQFPQWADLAVRPVEHDGWDNTSFRLGDSLSVRLPSHEMYVPQIEKEHHWLPVLAPQLPLAIPTPVALGARSAVFERPWSVYSWIPGELATTDHIRDPLELAADVAGFLAALYAVDASDGLAFGAHSFGRGGPLSSRDEETRECIATLSDLIDSVAVLAAWDRALSAVRADDEPGVWTHGDVTPANLLATDGRLSAVIDFGCSSVGDPACDMTMAWTVFSGESRAVFRSGLPVDDDTWRRGSGWALWKALITIFRARQTDPTQTDPTQTDPTQTDPSGHLWGWRLSTREVIEAIVADPTLGV
jgi:aminoglycoside phosphotransferase (APT) family kinase protein